VDAIRGGPIVPRPSSARQDEKVDHERSLLVHLSDFAWQALEEESIRLGVSIEELVGFSVLYYIADVDSGRIARSGPTISK
jgi:hypothetical protein